MYEDTEVVLIALAVVPTMSIVSNVIVTVMLLGSMLHHTQSVIMGKTSTSSITVTA